MRPLWKHTHIVCILLEFKGLYRYWFLAQSTDQLNISWVCFTNTNFIVLIYSLMYLLCVYLCAQWLVYTDNQCRSYILFIRSFCEPLIWIRVGWGVLEPIPGGGRRVDKHPGLVASLLQGGQTNKHTQSHTVAPGGEMWEETGDPGGNPYRHKKTNGMIRKTIPI